MHPYMCTLVQMYACTDFFSSLQQKKPVLSPGSACPRTAVTGQGSCVSRHPCTNAVMLIGSAKKPVRSPSVGADGGQPSKTHTFSIAETDAEFNENFSDSQDFFQKLQRAKVPDNPAAGLSSDPAPKPCRAIMRDDATIKHHPQKHRRNRRNRRAPSRREEFGLLGRQSDREKAAAGKRTGEIISLSFPVKNTSRRPSGIGGTPNRPWVGKEFSSLRDPVLPFVATESKIKYKIDYNRVSCEGG